MFIGTTLQLSAAGDGVILLTLGRADGISRLDAQFLRDLDGAISEIERTPSAKGLVIVSSQPDFMTGSLLADVYAAMGRRAEGEGGAREMYRLQIEASASLFHRISCLEIPTACVISGKATGAGASLALAVGRRIMIDGSMLGWPEVRLGLSPAQGACIRAPDLVGLEAAANLLTSGDCLSDRKAVEVGVADEWAPTLDSGLSEAVAGVITPTSRARGQGAAGAPAGEVLRRVEARVAQQAPHFYPAQRHILRLLHGQFGKPQLQGLAAEAALHCRLANSTSVRDLISVALAEKASLDRMRELCAAAGPGPEAPLVVIDGASNLSLAASVAEAFPGAVLMCQSSEMEQLREGLKALAPSALGTREWRGEGAKGLRVDAVLLLAGVDTDVARGWWIERIEEATPHGPPIICVLGQSALTTVSLPASSKRGLAGLRFARGASGVRVPEVVFSASSTEASVSLAAKLALATGGLPFLVRDVESGPCYLLQKTFSETCQTLIHPSLPPALIDYALTMAGFPAGMLEHCRRAVADQDRQAYVSLGAGAAPVGLRILSDSDIVSLVTTALAATAQHLRRTGVITSAHELDALSIRLLGFPAALGGLCQNSDARDSSIDPSNRALTELFPHGIGGALPGSVRPFYPDRDRGLISPMATRPARHGSGGAP